MIEKIKALPEKVAFRIGFTLILSSPILLYLLSLLFSFGNWTTRMVQGIAYSIAVIFILSAADKKHSRFDKKSNTLINATSLTVAFLERNCAFLM